ncbi:MAG: exosortase-dependent surface protein XDP1 [Halioglobus sp.]
MVYKQKILGFMAAVGMMAVYSMPSLANVQTWTFNSATQSFNNTNNGNTLSLTSSDGIHLTVSGFSDTGDVSGADLVETGRLIWANSTALGVANRDEGIDPASPHHSTDSVRSGSDADGDFDMLLLEFDTAVNLTGMTLNWAQGGNVANTADVSILAYVGPGSSALVGNTWASVLDTNGGAYDSVGNYSNVNLSYYAVNPTSVTSTKWLIGAYNPVFGAGGDASDDGFKLASLTTSTTTIPDQPPGEVPAPGTLALLIAGLLGLRSRRAAKVAS